MEKHIQHGNYRLRPLPLPDEGKNAILRYLAQIASEVTSGQLDPARVNWRYIRTQISDVIHHYPASQ